MAPPRKPRSPGNPAAGLFFAGLLFCIAGAGSGFTALRLSKPWENTDRAALIFAGTAILTGIFWIAALAKR